MMNGVTNYGMSMNSQVNFQSKNSSAKRTFNVVKTHQKCCNNAKIENFVKETKSKFEEIMQRLNKREITLAEGIDALQDLKMQVEKFETLV